MTVLNVCVTLSGNCEEAGTQCSFLISTPINEEQINGLIPYEGKFYYRVKTPGHMAGCSDLEYVWMDLGSVDNSQLLSIAEKKSNQIDLQAILLELDNPDDNSESYDNESNNISDYYDYLNKVSHTLHSELESR